MPISPGPPFGEMIVNFPGFDPYNAMNAQQKRDFNQFLSKKGLQKVVEKGVEGFLEKGGLVLGITLDKMDLFGKPLNATEAAAEEKLINAIAVEKKELADQAERRDALAIAAADAIAKAAALPNGTGGQFPSWLNDPPG